MNRREFLKRASSVAAVAYFGSLAAACGGEDESLSAFDGTHEGSVVHLLPTVSSDRMLIKASFTSPQDEAPELAVDGTRVAGTMTDSEGLFWAFDADGLEPGHRYTLELRRGDRHLIDPWELSTFPAPDARPERLRLLMYTCAGGNDIFELYVPVATRQRLLRRALSFEPDAVVANGDHVYWDLRAALAAIVTGRSALAEEHAGVFDRTADVLGTANESVLKRAVGPQIAGLYGTMFRSLPVFFLRDDHDYFEDDQVTEELTTFPPDDFMRRLARASQWLYYPEFLPDRDRPPDLPGSSAGDRPGGVSEAFGTLRYGRLFEGLLYDCKGFMTLEGEQGTLIPPSVEAWLLSRMAEAEQNHVVNLPSNPPGWSAGKFAEWYPDVLGESGGLTTAIAKPGWQEGWLEQHDRILSAASAMDRIPLFMSGDIHSIAEGRILRSGAHDFGDNPIVSVVTGTPGTGVGWPSIARGTIATPPEHIDLEEVVPVQEVNGFHIVDFTPEKVTIQHFRWNREEDPEDAIDTLQPFHVSEYETSR
ncbi:MAG: hypothetical protein IIC89_07865 [Chloroflexi bacterium]|nr:hypothetical protein [Chloroflexota bacterium]